MKLTYLNIIAGLLLAVPASSFSDLVIVDTLPANNQANLNPDAGQTFTTGLLGLDVNLSTIEIAGPQTGAPATSFTIELWTDTDQNFVTWDPGTLVATSINSAPLVNNAVTTYTFNNEVLSDSTVYAFTYTDGGGTRVLARPGLSNASTIPDGTVFASGAQVFAGGFDTSFRLTTTSVVPEPSALALLGFGALLLSFWRRR